MVQGEAHPRPPDLGLWTHGRSQSLSARVCTEKKGKKEAATKNAPEGEIKPPTPRSRGGHRVGYKKAKERAWRAFSAYIRLRDAIRTTSGVIMARCVTCSTVRTIDGVGCMQAGHFLPGRRMGTLFDERNVHAQCYVCNVRLSGNWPEYLDFMTRTYGPEVVEELRRQDRQTVSMMPHQLLELEAEFKRRRQALLDRFKVLSE